MRNVAALGCSPAGVPYLGPQAPLFFPGYAAALGRSSSSGGVYLHCERDVRSSEPVRPRSTRPALNTGTQPCHKSPRRRHQSSSTSEPRAPISERNLGRPRPRISARCSRSSTYGADPASAHILAYVSPDPINLGRLGPSLAQTRARQCRPSHALARARPVYGRLRPRTKTQMLKLSPGTFEISFLRRSANFVRIRTKLASVGQIFISFVSNLAKTPGHLWPEEGQLWLNSGKAWPKSDKIGHHPARHRQQVCRNMPNLVKRRQASKAMLGRSRRYSRERRGRFVHGFQRRSKRCFLFSRLDVAGATDEDRRRTTDDARWRAV